MRAPSPLHLLAACALWGAVPEASGQDRILSPEYEHALRLYARGERTAAVAALGRLRPAQIDGQIDALEAAARRALRCASCPNPVRELPLKAAAMLHVDRDQ